ncbi:MAG: deoxyribonuclease IV [Endomicrobia bacterium]|nr:deoxyribonuclease IV [Endomicrobiia bacterium]
MLKKFKNITFILLLENVCGNGRKIGRTFYELAEIINKSKFKKFIGICFDTAHGFSFGYDISTEEGNQRLIAELNMSTGLDKLYLIHLNDTKAKLNSKIDQHYHIAKGTIGKKGFRIFLKYFHHLPLILETPKETSFDKISQKDKQNIKTVKKLIRWYK